MCGEDSGFFIRLSRYSVYFLLLPVEGWPACSTFWSDMVSSENSGTQKVRFLLIALEWKWTREAKMSQIGTFMVSVHLKIFYCFYWRQKDMDSATIFLKLIFLLTFYQEWIHLTLHLHLHLHLYWLCKFSFRLTKQGRGNRKVIPPISHRHISRNVTIAILGICFSPLDTKGTQAARLDWLKSGELIQYVLVNQEPPKCVLLQLIKKLAITLSVTHLVENLSRSRKL